MLMLLDMDGASMNPYEEQLYTVFKTFDVDNEEALDKSAVLDLCDALQLEDRGAALVDTLFARRSERVTFTQFRNGLLSVLSGGERAAVAPGAAPAPGPAAPGLAALGPTPHSDEDSSGREVAPKFVFGSKKYGRRSRPQRPSSSSGGSPRAASVSRLDAEDGRQRSSQRMRFRRSASAMESREFNSTTDDDDAAPAPFDHDRRIDCDQAFRLCRELHMDGIDRDLVERIFESSRVDETTVGEFFDRLNASLTSSIEVSRDVHTRGDDDADEDAGVASELVVDAWERAGVPRPRRLLLELGFGAVALRPPDLERALDDELAALAEPLDERRDVRCTLLAAALALGRLRAARARRRAELAAAERDKLRADVAEANKRARLLAQDVDENHARMEAELAADLRRTEARHVDAARRAAEDAAAERERAAVARARLETELKRRDEEETRVRAELEGERSRGARAEARANAAEGRAAAAEREAVRLAEEARRAAAAGAAGAACGGGAAAPAAELAARLEELRREAAALRDRNDELCALLEERGAGARAAGGGAGGAAACGGDLSTELHSLMALEALKECDSSPASMEQKTVIDQHEAANRLRSIFQAFDCMSIASDKKCESCIAMEHFLSEIRTRVQELSETEAPPSAAPPGPPPTYLAPPGLPPTELAPPGPPPTETAPPGPPPTKLAAPGLPPTEIAPSGPPPTELAPPDPPPTELAPPAAPALGDHQDGDVNSLKKHLSDVKCKQEEEKQKNNDLIRELETSLEQMRDEYERCEEYWARKLDEERAAADDERRAGDERLADLVARIADYERSFAPARALPPIEERAALEAQVADLEREYAEHRARADEQARAREHELRALRAAAGAAAGAGAGAAAGAGARGRCACAGAVARLGALLAGERGAGAREALGLRGRAARAEAAVRRLQARLAAADVLVQELYVENCQLAHRRA